MVISDISVGLTFGVTESGIPIGIFKVAADTGKVIGIKVGLFKGDSLGVEVLDKVGYGNSDGMGDGPTIIRENSFDQSGDESPVEVYLPILK